MLIWKLHRRSRFESAFFPFYSDSELQIGPSVMGNLKKKWLVGTPMSKDGSVSDLDTDGEDSWVIVKKQRVTILIPPLPDARKSTMPKPGPSNHEAMPVKVVNNKSTLPVEASNRMPSVNEQEKVGSVITNGTIKTSKKIPAQQTMASNKVQRPHVEMGSKRAHTSKSHDIQISNISKTIKRSRQLHRQGHFLDGSMLLNQSLRASLLEKKLQKAGGLSRWLASIGLGQFVKIFQGNISKFQLVNLTMKKLKDMGADAIGPRRKLMHAIDCICQPYCFETL